MSQLQQKKKEVIRTYDKLKKVEQAEEKITLSKQLLAVCLQIENLLEREKPSEDTFRWTRQINDIKKKVADIQNEAERERERARKPPVRQTNMSREQMSRIVVRSIIFKELTSKEMKVTTSELEKLAHRMEGNLEVMKQIQGLINDQGQDLDKIEDNLSKAYLATNEANKDLQQAADLQTQTRLLKIRAGFMGILAAIGWGIVGIPGLIVGLFAGWRTTKKSS